MPSGLPSVAELFTFMRDAELRFATLRMRIVDRSRDARGDEATNARGQPSPSRPRQGHDERGRRGDRRRLRHLDLRRRPRPDLRGRPQARHAAADPQPPARSRRPGPSRVRQGLRAGHSPADRDAARTRSSTPAACARTSSRRVDARSPARSWPSGARRSRSSASIPVRPRSPRDRPDYRLYLTIDRATGVILRLIETIGGTTTRDAEVMVLDPDAALPPIGIRVRLPVRDDDALLSPRGFQRLATGRIVRPTREAAARPMTERHDPRTHATEGGPADRPGARHRRHSRGRPRPHLASIASSSSPRISARRPARPLPPLSPDLWREVGPRFASPASRHRVREYR